MKKEAFETPAIEAAMLDEVEVIETGDCCCEDHCGD